MKMLSVDMSGSNIGTAFWSVNAEARPQFIDHCKVDVPNLTSTSINELRSLRAYVIFKYMRSLMDTWVPAVVAWEVPHGGRTIQTKATFGMIAGIMGSLRALYDLTLIGVSPMDAKKAAQTGKASPTKRQMITAMYDRYPHLQWQRRGKELLLQNEHAADALAIGLAALKTETFDIALKGF